MTPLPPDVTTLPVTPLIRADVARVAAEVLTVKAGKFAERPPSALDVVVLATWILNGRVTVSDRDLDPDAFRRTLVDLQAEYDRVFGAGS